MTLRRLAKFAPWAAIALVMAVALVIGTHRSGPPPSIAERTQSIAQGIRCPTCEGQTVANSTVFAAKAIEADIGRRLRSGQTPTQIRAYLVSRYGTSILESPPTHGLTALLWILPAVIVPAAAVTLIVGFRRARPGPVPPLSEEDRALVAQALRPPSSPEDTAAGETVPDDDTGPDETTEGPPAAQLYEQDVDADDPPPISGPETTTTAAEVTAERDS
ncbi:cytochrome c-type biogenesis protein CcmH [Acidiferrimicrobium sp. IK]|uniref:cytochrome c-type biogenesis protein n=1 Tax=Acidiferrimicrobium sp. IK TaxID=2871700 RepID=UPI0021CB41F3|nr:cytochrome c-type biogenesis protein CcmH [Acidiferrimicrobium sp. IK]MCU4185760.1 cytochrome c-type biogenesis protein CcmH [Acidiferrimicrobium sp. IK]